MLPKNREDVNKNMEKLSNIYPQISISKNSIVNCKEPSSNSNCQLSIDVVDALANDLVTEYNNPKYRQWYCGVIYQYGIAQVEEWRGRAREWDIPGAGFTTYVKQARRYNKPGMLQY